MFACPLWNTIMLDQDRQDGLLKNYLSAFYSVSRNQWPTCDINNTSYRFQGLLRHYQISKMWIYHLFVFWSQQNRNNSFSWWQYFLRHQLISADDGGQKKIIVIFAFIIFLTFSFGILTIDLSLIMRLRWLRYWF